MDSSRTNLYQEDVTELLRMLESSDIQTVESVKALIQENLSTTKDVWLLHGLVNYHIAFQSKHALEILVRVRDPHDKHLFDKMAEFMKPENTRYQCLLLLSHIVHSQPPWLHKITSHRIFQTLLTLLKSEKDSPSLLCALFIMVCLLPMIPSQIGPYLNDIFDIFSRLASWTVKNSIGVPEIYVLHLQVGVYTLFHRLYGMYPCNFLGYLRSYYSRKEYKEDNLCVFTNAIKPMLQRVKLHPLLVTSCKETEVSSKRWRKMAAHDIVVECASISLDSIEGGGEDVHTKRATFVSGFGGNAYPISHENSSQYVSFSSQSSTTSLTVEPNSVVSEAMNAKQDVIWSPSFICDIATSAQILHTPSELEDSVKKLSLDCSSQSNIDSELHAIDVVDEKSTELADKEVSELTDSVPNPDIQQEHLDVRYDTPFCSTTQNLTDKPEISDLKPICLTKNDDDQMDILSQEQSEMKIETFVQTINRFRYLSQCCMPSDLATEKSDKPTLLRSQSCPNIIYDLIQSNSTICGNRHETLKDNISPICSPIVPVVTSASSSYLEAIHDSTSFSSSPHDVDTHYAHLLPMVVQPMSSAEGTSSSEKSMTSTCMHMGSLSSYNFTPAELLDRHILLSNETYLGQLNSIPLTSTKNVKWTHFGGKPPADEIAILQTQILLLHNQLMFERHRSSMHTDRNRRLLGKAKRTQMQEEYTTALKDQVSMLERENDKLKKQVAHIHELYGAMYQEKKNADNSADCTIKKLVQEKHVLQYSIKTLQGLLVAQKHEIEAISDAQKLGQSKVIDLELENEVLKRDNASFLKREKEFLQLCNQNALLHEQNELYIQRLEAAKKPIIENDTIDLIRDAATVEIKGLKRTLESKSLQADIGLSKINELEIEITSLKRKIIEQAQIIEHLEALHKDEITAREDRLRDLKRIIHQTETHILQLYHVQGQLNDEIKMLTSKLKRIQPVLDSPVVASAASCSKECTSNSVEENVQNLIEEYQDDVQGTSELR